MADAFAESTARLESLLRQAIKETDPSKCNDLTAEIWRVLEERDRLKSALAIQKSPDEPH
jgi:IS4 transposase